MKRTNIKRRARRHSRGLALTLALVCALTLGSAFTFGALSAPRTASAEAGEAPAAAAPAVDTSPAIYVAQKNANSVVGIITSAEGWSRGYGTQSSVVGQGSGVVIKEGGYVLTNYHVIEDGNSFQVLLPGGDKVSATVVGTDSDMDLAVLKVEEQADALVPVTLGSSTNLPVGSTVIAIGNPGGEVLANTVTQGIISALERSSVSSSNTSRNVNYIQHDAPISSGNSGGGLFDFQGNLIGINTLKYAGSFYSSGTYEGLGFAIPVETAWPIAEQLIEFGQVIRPQMGVMVRTQDGPDEPMNDYAPASVCVYSVNEGSPAEAAGIEQYDFITAINGERVTNLRELTTVLDSYKPGDTVTITVVRYNTKTIIPESNNNYYDGYGYPFGGYGFGFPFGGYGYGYGNGGYGYGNGGYGNNGNNGNSAENGTLTVGGGYQTLDLELTLEARK